MRQVQSSVAKTHLPELLDDVERGETIAITRHGKVIARLVPEVNERRARVERAMRELEELRKSAPPTGLTIDEIIEMRHEGHRY